MVEKKYFSISEVADMFKVNQSLLRFWETQFDNLNPKRSPKGRRYYSHDDVELLKSIFYLMREQKLTIEGAKKRLRGNRDALDRQRRISEKLHAIRKELVAIRRELNQQAAIEGEDEGEE